MAWFGPRPCNCRCGTPPPPECACDASDCYPAGRRQFSSIRIEVETDDTWEWFYEEDRIDCLQFGPCRNQWQYRTFHQGVSGLSQFNGTYDAIYYVTPDSGPAAEGDPGDDPCGIWVFPTIEANVSAWRVLENKWSGGCEPDSSNAMYDDEFTAVMQTRSGYVSLLDFPPLPGQVDDEGFPAYGTNATIGGGVLTSPFATAKRTVTGFECDENAHPTDVTNYSWRPGNGSLLSSVFGVLTSVRPLSNTNLAIGPGGSGTSTPNATLPTAPAGVMVGHRKGSSCTIGVMESKFEIPAYEYEWFSSTPDCGTLTSGRPVRRSKIYWPAKTWTVRATFNA